MISPCVCIDRMNKKLAFHNTVMSVEVKVKTKKLEMGLRAVAANELPKPTFCPFCGRKRVDDEYEDVT